MEPYAGVDYNSPYLIVNSLVSYSPHYKGKGVDLGRSLLLVEHIFCIYLLISKTGFLCKQYGEGGVKGREMTLCLIEESV